MTRALLVSLRMRRTRPLTPPSPSKGEGWGEGLQAVVLGLLLLLTAGLAATPEARGDVFNYRKPITIRAEMGTVPTKFCTEQANECSGSWDQESGSLTSVFSPVASFSIVRQSPSSFRSWVFAFSNSIP